MNTLNLLTDLHIRESDARLRHVDELMAKPRPGAGTERVGEQADVAGRVQASSGPLEVIGLELEKALTAVLETGHK